MVATGQDSGSSDAAGGSPARNGQRVAMAGEMGAGTGTGTDAISATPSAAATPASELSESDGGVVGDSKTTVTTEYVRGSGKEAEDRIEKESFTLTHQGAKGISHRVDKDGSIHLRPKGRGSRVRTLVSFRPRESHFDRHNRTAAGDPFRGFYTLFWIILAILMLNTFYHSFSKTGQIVSLTFWTLFSKDAIVLALSDGVLVGSLFLCVPFAKVLEHGWFRYWPSLIWVQHTWQACLLAGVIKWARYRDWPWVQSGFFVLHTLSMMMKIHSYMAINGYMADLYFRMKRLEDMVEERVADVEGTREGEHAVGKGGVTEEAWTKAVEKARAAAAGDTSRELLKAPAADQVSSQSKEKTKATAATAGTDGVAEEDQKSWDSLPGQRGTSVLRQRANASIVERRPSASLTERPSFQTAQASHTVKKNGKPKELEKIIIRDPHPLATHPDKVISELAREVELIREELTSSSTGDDPQYQGANADVYVKTVTWPDNVTFANFWDYLLVPTLVYELSYPRIKTRRPLYLLEKALATFGTFFVIYVITEHWIMPHQPDPSTPLLQTFLELAVPMILNYLLIFYIMFECICQFFAEWTRFADRLFYEDWWNATSMDVFSRKWNRPVHSFLLRHVYASSITVGLPKAGAMFVTFLLSSLLHELVMAIVSGKIRGYLFAMQMAQIPLIAVGQIPFVKNNESLGNIIFWVGLCLGFPLLNIAYLAY